MSSVVASVFFIPEWDVMLKVYVISVVVFITGLINVLFRIQKIREMVVNAITADVIQQILKDPDVRKLMQLTSDYEVKIVRRKKVEVRR
jgi:hypothetical protein